MKLRPYQQASVDAFFRDARLYPKDAQLIAAPTGAGKSVIIAEICRRTVACGFRVLVLARTKELLVQNHQRFCQVSGSHDAAGIYSAGLGVRQPDHDIVFASVQTLVNCPDAVGHRQLIIVDEAHQIPTNEDSQYQRILGYIRNRYGSCKLLGLTASPYRLDGGVIFGGNDTQFDRLSYSIPLSDLFDEGSLTKPQTLPVVPVDVSKVKKSGGDFNRSEMQTVFLGRSITEEVVAAANENGCKSCLVFASGVAHAELIHAELGALGEKSRVVTGETLPLLRETYLTQFDNGSVRWLVNVDVLTTGYDCTRIDCVVLARATESPGLFYQMVGRGFRLHDGKDICHIIDYGGNIERHGEVDSPTFGIDTIKPPSAGKGEAPKRVCPTCFTVQHASRKTCINCDLEFPAAKKEPAFASKKSITVKSEEYLVASTHYKRHKGRDGKKDTLLVRYRLHEDKSADLTTTRRWAQEWICLEHDPDNFARKKAEQWWRERSAYHTPTTIDEAIAIAENGGIADVRSITVRPDGKYDRIVGHKVGHKPPPVPIDLDLDDAPF